MTDVTPLSVFDVFKTQGKPTITYVEREQGSYEKKLWGVINNRGTICVVTGPSKTGKTSLCAKVADQNGFKAVKVRCDQNLSPEDFWRTVLEELAVERRVGRQAEDQTGTQVGGKIFSRFNLPGVLGFGAESNLGTTSEHADSAAYETIVARPTAAHVVPVLKKKRACLIVEDFHYLTPEVKRIIFQQWKVFVDVKFSSCTAA